MTDDEHESERTPALLAARSLFGICRADEQLELSSSMC